LSVVIHTHSFGWADLTSPKRKVTPAYARGRAFSLQEVLALRETQDARDQLETEKAFREKTGLHLRPVTLYQDDLHNLGVAWPTD
jgi:hypothetical protein